MIDDMPMVFGLAISTKHFGKRFNRDWKAGHVGISVLNLLTKAKAM
jgi:hypothetical protein